MIGQRICPICKSPALRGCPHLALAIEARLFVRQCVELSGAYQQWKNLCLARDAQLRREGKSICDSNDFTWLESAFSDEFLRHLPSFKALDYEWRTGARADQGGFWVLLWSGHTQKLWWELRDELDQKCAFALESCLPLQGGLQSRNEEASFNF
jgi:hypothetical protein